MTKQQPTLLSKEDVEILFPWAMVAQRCELLWRFGLIDRATTFLVGRVLAAIQRSLLNSGDEEGVQRRLFWISFLANLKPFLQSALIVPAHGLAIGHYNLALSCKNTANHVHGSIEPHTNFLYGEDMVNGQKVVFNAQVVYISKRTAENVRNGLLEAVVDVLLRIVEGTLIERGTTEVYRDAFPLIEYYKMPCPIATKLATIWLTIALKDIFNRLMDGNFGNATCCMSAGNEATRIFSAAKEVIDSNHSESDHIPSTEEIQNLLEDGEIAFRRYMQRLMGMVQTLQVQNATGGGSEVHQLNEDNVPHGGAGGYGMPQGIIPSAGGNSAIFSALLIFARIMQLEMLLEALKHHAVTIMFHSMHVKYFLLTPSQILYVLNRHKEIDRSWLYIYYRKTVRPWRKSILEMSRIGSLHHHAITATHMIDKSVEKQTGTTYCKEKYPSLQLVYNSFRYHETYGAFEPPIKEHMGLKPGTLSSLVTDM